MNLNKACIIGNVTRDPEIRTLPSGQPVATFGVATNRFWKDQSGNKKQSVEFHNVVAFGRLAEISKQYLGKGKLVYAEGRLQTRTWESPDGSKRNRTEIIVERMQLGPRTASGAEPVMLKEEAVDTIEYPHDEGEINPDEIPF